MALESAARGSEEAAGVVAESDLPNCGVCLLALDPNDSSDPIMHLPCMHALHRECFSNISERWSGEDGDLKCPTCGKTPNNCAADEARLMSGAAAAVTPPTSPIVVSPSPGVAQETTVEAPLEATLEDVAFALSLDGPPPASPTETTAFASPRLSAVSSVDTEQVELEPPVDVFGRPRVLSYMEAPVPLVAPRTLYCGTCSSPCVADKFRLTSKKDRTVRCPKCQVKLVQLYRAYGAWPTDEFRALSPDDQKEFMKQIGNVEGMANVKAKSQELFRRFTTQEEYFEDGGKFLPLKVWERKGFDAVAIQSHTDKANVIEHPVLGTCYRVSVIGRGTRGATGWERDSRLAGGRGKAKAAPATAPAAIEEGKEEEDAAAEGKEEEDAADDDNKKKKKRSRSSSSSDSSSSSSSSSSSDGKRRKHKSKKAKKSKKDKKNKKAKKEKARLAKAAKKAKAKEQEDKKAVKAATKQHAARAKVGADMEKKLATSKLPLSALIARPEFLHVPPTIRGPIEDGFRALEDAESKCHAVALDGSRELPGGLTCVKDRLLLKLVIYYSDHPLLMLMFSARPLSCF